MFSRTKANGEKRALYIFASFFRVKVNCNVEAEALLIKVDLSYTLNGSVIHV